MDSGEFITRDPTGFEAGPNFYTYVEQNPWAKFDPEGLSDDISGPMTMEDSIIYQHGDSNTRTSDGTPSISNQMNRDVENYSREPVDKKVLNMAQAVLSLLTLQPEIEVGAALETSALRAFSSTVNSQ